MGKRKHKEKDPEKIRRLERRLEYQTELSDSEEYNDSEHSFSSVVSIPMDHSSTREPLTYTTNFEQSSKDNTIHETPALDIDILEALRVSKHKVETFAPKIRNEISERWEKIIVDGLSKDSLQKLMENIHIPENFKLLKAPQLNAEISTVLSESTKNRDKHLEKAQNHLGIGIAAITNLMSTLIDGEMEKTDIIKKLSEIGQLFLDLHCQNTYSRRKLITFSLDKKILTLIRGVNRDSFLFGENLGDKIKANKTAERSGFQVKRTFEPQSSTSYRSNQSYTRQGNARGPPRSQTQSQRGRRGGPRSQVPPQTRRPPVTSEHYHTTKTSSNKPVQKN